MGDEAVPRRHPSIAVLVPCHNEANTVATVVQEFRAAFPQGTVYVYDNDSTDDTAAVARASGAVVRGVPQRGKGHVVRRMLADIDADVYLLVDGDGTYEAAAGPAMVDLLLEQQLDMVTGVRIPDAAAVGAYRAGHAAGNRFFTMLNRRLFGAGCTDVFSGYRALSRRFVKSVPLFSDGFEIEAEMTAHALDVGAAMGELPCRYTERVAGSESKLRTYRDGTRILIRSVVHFKELRPFRFFATIALLLAVASLAVGTPVIVEFAGSGEVPRFPSAILSVGLGVVAAMALVCGTILHSVASGRREVKQLRYLALSAPGSISPPDRASHDAARAAPPAVEAVR
jgi:glycosyltransferase involved in cell wall biosynthesis